MSENTTQKWSAVNQAEMSKCPWFTTEIFQNLDIRILDFIMKEMLSPKDSEFYL